MIGRATGRACLAAGVILFATALVAGCGTLPGMGGGAVVQETLNQTVSAAGVTALDLQGSNGACEVRQGTGSEIVIQATKRSRYGQAELDQVSVSVTGEPTLVVRTVVQPATSARVSVDYLIQVPATVGMVRVQTSNGAIRVSGIGGDADLRTSNGAIDVAGTNGTVTARTSNGAITIQDAASLGDLETSNGRIAADVLAVKDDIAIRTSNGAVDLALGPALSAVIDAETSGSQISVPPGLVRVDEQSATRLRATAGAGGHTITVRTSNGQIRFTAAG